MCIYHHVALLALQLRTCWMVFGLLLCRAAAPLMQGMPIQYLLVYEQVCSERHKLSIRGAVTRLQGIYKALASLMLPSPPAATRMAPESKPRNSSTYRSVSGFSYITRTLTSCPSSLHAVSVAAQYV